jgi:hypothetical protein
MSNNRVESKSGGEEFYDARFASTMNGNMIGSKLQGRSNNYWNKMAHMEYMMSTTITYYNIILLYMLVIEKTYYIGIILLPPNIDVDLLQRLKILS